MGMSLTRAFVLATGMTVALGNSLIESQESGSTVQDVCGNTKDKIKEIIVNHTILKDGTRETTTDNFRIVSKLGEADATAAAKVLEQTRTDTRKTLLGLDDEKWSERCDVFIHDNADAYTRETNASKESGGKTIVELDDRTWRVIRRIVHTHKKDTKHLLTRILPHEARHTVLNGAFGKYELPLCINEGASIVSEEGTLAEHRKKLAKAREDSFLIFTIAEMLAAKQYPQFDRDTFHGQSGVMFDFLSRKHAKGAQGAIAFGIDCTKGDHNKTAERHFGMNLDKLNDLFFDDVFRAVAGPMKMK